MVKNQLEMMKAIGGYFSLELSIKRADYIHERGIHLNSGRNALEYILKSISDIQCLWIPYYTCDVVLEPLKKLDISYRFYSVNENLELAVPLELHDGEYLLVTNYFGIKDAYIKQLSTQYGERLIVDNAQAFFAEPIEVIKSVYSPRKFVGIPDGGIAYMEKRLDISRLEQDVSYRRCSHLLKRLDLGAEAGYADFRENSHQLVNQPVKRMSNLTWNFLQSIDFNSVKELRRENFKRLHDALKGINRLGLPDMDTFACPMVYPFYTLDTTLKKRLINNKIFVATYWPNVLEWCNEGELEYELCKNIIPIPIDQRYGEEEMKRIINLITNGTNSII